MDEDLSRLSHAAAEALNPGELFFRHEHDGEMLKVVSIEILTNTAIVRELTPWEEICHEPV